eukprot:3589338-Alexandrium_andersonii.AAC.1
MSASLVGSEMCIRDRSQGDYGQESHLRRSDLRHRGRHRRVLSGGSSAVPVSYTHLTLPTICSV